MLSKIQKTIIIKAVKIRLEKGERLEEIMQSYPKLTAEEQAEIREELGACA